MVYLWRAVDGKGEVLDALVQSKRNKNAALKLMRKLLRKYAVVPERMVTDDLRSYGAATLDLGIDHLHNCGRWKNNRAENSRQPTRRRERKMLRFKSAGSAQKFLSTHAAAYNTFNVQRHLTQGNRIWIFAENERPTKDLPDETEHHLDGYFRRQLDHSRPNEIALPSHVSTITPRAPRRPDEHVARGSRGRMTIRNLIVRSRPSRGNVTMPFGRGL